MSTNGSSTRRWLVCISREHGAVSGRPRPGPPDAAPKACWGARALPVRRANWSSSQPEPTLRRSSLSRRTSRLPPPVRTRSVRRSAHWFDRTHCLRMRPGEPHNGSPEACTPRTFVESGRVSRAASDSHPLAHGCSAPPGRATCRSPRGGSRWPRQRRQRSRRRPAGRADVRYRASRECAMKRPRGSVHRAQA